MNITLFIEGGIIQNVWATWPGHATITVVDADTDGMDPDDLVNLPNGDFHVYTPWVAVIDDDTPVDVIETIEAIYA